MNQSQSFALFLILLIAIASLTVGSIRFVLAQSGTSVGGLISSDTTWTAVNSPYNLIGPVGVVAGVTLTIQPGVTVNLNSYYMQINGSLSAIGTSTSPINITGVTQNPLGAPTTPHGLIFLAATNGNGTSGQTNGGSVLQNANINTISISTSSVQISNCHIADCLFIVSGSPVITDSTIWGINTGEYGGSPTISGNIITGDEPIFVTGGSPQISNNNIEGGCHPDPYGRPTYTQAGIQLRAPNNASITGNRIYGVFAVAGILVGDFDSTSRYGNNPTITGNSIANNYDAYLNAYCTGIKITDNGATPTIQTNTIAVNTVCPYNAVIMSSSSSAKINYNNFQGGNQTLYLLSGAASNVDATNNWWGTADQQAISQTIHDFKNDFTLGTVNFVPFLTAPNPQAPSLPTPTPTPTPIASPTASPPPPSASATAASTIKPAGSGPFEFSVPAPVFVAVVAILLAVIVLLLVLLYTRHRKTSK